MEKESWGGGDYLRDFGISEMPLSVGFRPTETTQAIVKPARGRPPFIGSRRGHSRVAAFFPWPAPGIGLPTEKWMEEGGSLVVVRCKCKCRVVEFVLLGWLGNATGMEEKRDWLVSGVGEAIGGVVLWPCK